MKITILTMFPHMLKGLFESPLVQRAQKQNIAEINVVDIKDFADGSFRHIDDSPYGGTPGMIIRMEPLVKSLESVKKENSHTVLFSPKGQVFNQNKAKALAKEENLILVCGHYEGTDARFDDYVDEFVSVGDYVLSGGEYAATIVVDSITRLLKGTLKDGVTDNESHENGLLEYPQYTHPLTFRNQTVPQILLSGNTKEIEKWKHVKAIEETKKHRPDMAKLYADKSIKDSEQAFVCLFSETEQISENLTFYKDQKLPDMYDHNFYFYKNTLTDSEIEDRIKANKASNRDFVKFQSSIRLPEELKARYRFEEACIDTLALYDTGKAQNWQTDKSLEIRSIKTDNIYKDIVQMELENYGEAYGIDFTQRKMHRYLTKAKNCKNLDFLAAYKNGQLVSYLYTFESNDCVAIDSLFTSPEYRHKKAATTLLAHACSKAQFAYLHADAEDTPIQMYKALGFTTVSESWEYVGKFTE